MHSKCNFRLLYGPTERTALLDIDCLRLSTVCRNTFKMCVNQSFSSKSLSVSIYSNTKLTMPYGSFPFLLTLTIRNCKAATHFV